MKKIYTKIVFYSAIICSFQLNTITAQEKHCGTTEATQALYLQHPELIQKEIDYNNSITQLIKNKKQQKSTLTAEPVYIIPMVFHILHVNGTENISDAQIFDEVNILNRDYRKLNADTSAIVKGFDTLDADIKVEFRLAQRDPDGNCTNGIDRIYTHKTNNADDASKLNQWPRDKYLNVWVVKTIGSAGVAGYAYYPSAVDGAGYPIDGVLILSNYIGSIGTGTPFTSRALTHEIGHWMNLQHPWGSTNSPEVACGDDLVDDTPVTKGHLSCDYNPYCTISPFASPYNFNGVTTTSGTTDTTHVINTLETNFGQFKANGVSANSSVAGQFAFTNWDAGGGILNNASSTVNQDTLYPTMTGSINTSKYYEVTVYPVYGSSMTITSIGFNFQRDTNGVRSYAIRSSLDGFAANLPAVSTNSKIKIKGANEFFITYDTAGTLIGNTVTCGTAFKNQLNPITFRIYGWNAEDATGSFGIDNVSINGTGGIIENVQNYMDYSYCSVMFTKGQKDRMRAALESTVSFRTHLWTSTNLAATGTDGSITTPCKPEPDFYADKYSICPGGSVKFTQNILYGTPTSIRWHFQTGPAATDTISSTAVSPTITFNNPGSYDVTLYATNAAGTGVTTKHYMISVSDAYAMVSPGLTTEDFDNSSLYYSRWVVDDLDHNNMTWWLTNHASYSGSQSIYINSFYDYPFDVDDIYSPSYNLSFVTSAVLTFKCAAATKATASADLDDVLRVYISRDCGATWPVNKAFSGTALINDSYHPEEFVPNSPSQWAVLSYNLPSTFTTANTRFKFEYTSGHASNDIYIDDINISGTTGINENTLDPSSVSLYPNPTDQTTTLAYHLANKANVKIELVDVLGKKIMEQENNNQMEGDYAVQISKQDLHLFNGIYFVRISIDGKSTTKKLIIAE